MNRAIGTNRVSHFCGIVATMAAGRKDSEVGATLG
jgi:hypothetical protein